MKLPPVSPRVFGIDVSSLQGAIDWPRVGAWRGPEGERVEFAIMRAEVGDSVDSRYAANVRGARAVGIRVGSYGVLEPYADPIVQADAYVDPLLEVGIDPSDLPPVLDLELLGSQAPAKLLDMASAWCARVRARTGRKPLVYTARWFWQKLGNPVSSPLAQFALWVADYRGDTSPWLPRAWLRYLLWQFGGDHSGAIDGIPAGDNIDHIVFAGSSEDLEAFVAASYEHEPEAPAPPLSVLEAQQLLIAAGFPCGRWGADGQWGSGTTTAVRAFQARAGIAESGRLDGPTRTALAQLRAGSAPTEPPPTLPSLESPRAESITAPLTEAARALQGVP